MSERDLFKGMPEFMAVARRRSFRHAGEDLGITAVGVGAAVKQLEERLGMVLFHRTTRRVELSASGKILFERMAPMTSALQDTLREMRDRQKMLSGTLRISTQSLALDMALNPALVAFHAAHPEVAVEVEVREGRTDLIGEGFDFGLRLGEFIEDDVIATRLPHPVNWHVVGSTKYLDRNGRPERPEDLIRHQCIRRIWPGKSVPYRWEFQTGARPVEVDPPGHLSVSSFNTAIRLVAEGYGLCYLTTDMVEMVRAQTEAETVLDGFMPPPNYLYAYFSPVERENRRIRAFLDCLKAPIG